MNVTALKTFEKMYIKLVAGSGMETPTNSPLWGLREGGTGTEN
jgi:hypothetical protein